MTLSGELAWFAKRLRLLRQRRCLSALLSIMVSIYRYVTSNILLRNGVSTGFTAFARSRRMCCDSNRGAKTDRSVALKRERAGLVG
jgi:hypothetical protein